MKRKTVTLCMIARDEEASIGRAIKSALALVDEIIVVDTGSADNTRIIAEGYGARIVDHTWGDDFAAARNAALAAATSDWILILDCDEYLQSIRPLVFQRLLAATEAAAYRVQIVDQRADQGAAVDSRLRLFRHHPQLRFRYRVHEQVLPDLLPLAAEAQQQVLDAPLVVVHDPGGPDIAARKRERNLRLLRQAAIEQPEEPYFAYMLGSESLVWLEQEVLPVAGLGSGLASLQRAWRQVAAWPRNAVAQTAYGLPLAVDLAAALLAAGQAGAAAASVDEAAGLWPDDPRLTLLGVRARLALLAAEQDPRRREVLGSAVRLGLQGLGAALAGAPVELARRFQGQAQRCRGDLALAEGDVAAAAEAFEQALNLDQDQSSAWVGLAACARLAGDRKRALRLYLRAVTVNEWNVQAWERGCALMEELGFHDNARSWRAKVTERFPERPLGEPPPEPSGDLLPLSDMAGIS